MGGSGAPAVPSYTNIERKLDHLPADPAKFGYYFDGWYTSEQGGTKITLDHRFSSDCSLYAHYKEVQVESITLSRNSITIPYGGVSQNSATVNPDNLLLPENKGVRWVSNDESIAVVDRNGKVTAKKPGDTYITAISEKNPGKSARCDIHVVKADPVYTAPTAISNLIYEGGRSQKLINAGSTDHGTFYYAVTAKTAEAPPFDGESESPRRAWRTAVPFGMDPGTYRVHYYIRGDANHNDIFGKYVDVMIYKYQKQRVLYYSVKYGSSVSLDLSYSIHQGGRLIFDNYYVDSSTIIQYAGYKQDSAELILTMTDDRSLLGKQAVIGFKVIDAAEYYDYLVDVVITSSEKNSQRLFFEQNEISLYKGKSEYNPVSGNNTPVRYESSDESIATVDDKGTVTAIGRGSAKIRAVASANGDFFEGSAEYNVTVYDIYDKEEGKKEDNSESSDNNEDNESNENTDPGDGKKENSSGGEINNDDPEKNPSDDNKNEETDDPEKHPLDDNKNEEKDDPENVGDPDKDDIIDITVPDDKRPETEAAESVKVPVINPGDKYASSDDNFAGKLKDRNSVSTTGGVTVKVNKNTLIPKITCKGEGSAALTMDDGSTYTVNIRVEKPKANKYMRKVRIGETVIKNVRELFGTSIDSGELKVLSGENSRARVFGNSLIIDPHSAGKIKVRYRYLDKRYKMTINIR